MVGIDEVGRGCWAGPLLVVAVRAQTNLPAGLADSKVLSKFQRSKLIASIVESCEIGEGWVGPAEIDTVGLSQAMRLGVARALRAINVLPNELIVIDGNVNYCAPDYINVECVIKADASYPSVSAASIYAKVTRDQYMVQEALRYPGYGFEHHVGYGTKAHIDSLQRLGICTLHRKSFKPVRAFVV